MRILNGEEKPMIKIERKETEKTKQAIADLQKASETEGDYNTESVNQALKEIFHGKCYICENKAATSYQIEHLVPHRGDKTLKYDCFFRSGILWNNISKEGELPLPCDTVVPMEVASNSRNSYPFLTKRLAVRTNQGIFTYAAIPLTGIPFGFSLWNPYTSGAERNV